MNYVGLEQMWGQRDTRFSASKQLKQLQLRARAGRLYYRATEFPICCGIEDFIFRGPVQTLFDAIPLVSGKAGTPLDVILVRNLSRRDLLSRNGISALRRMIACTSNEIGIHIGSKQGRGLVDVGVATHCFLAPIVTREFIKDDTTAHVLFHTHPSRNKAVPSRYDITYPANEKIIGAKTGCTFVSLNESDPTIYELLHNYRQGDIQRLTVYFGLNEKEIAELNLYLDCKLQDHPERAWAILEKIGVHCEFVSWDELMARAAD